MDKAFIRIVFFVFFMVLFMTIQKFFPRRAQSPYLKDYKREASNIIIIFLNSLLVRFLIPILPIGMAMICIERGIGILNLFNFNDYIEIITAVIFLDIVIYWQHRLFHRVDILWKLHKMHHFDPEITTSTGLRFHPFEIMISIGIKLLAVIVIGASPLAVLIFEILLNVTAMFNHSNINIPIKVDRMLRKVLITPDVHRIHHSVYRDEMNANFGFSVVYWDIIFKTFINQPKDGHLNMRIGLVGSPEEKIYFPKMLWL
ncbi:MAG: sterol desaturase family protein [Clostridia bacterium]|nr:sterol desaturase family protein [Clostridia bacterium]